MKKPARVTRQDKNDVLKKGLITGYFGLINVGRPKKVQVKNTQQPIAAQVKNTKQPITAQVTRAKLACTRIQWNSEELFPILKASVLANKLKDQEARPL